MIVEQYKLNIDCKKHGIDVPETEPVLKVFIPNLGEEILKYTPERPTVIICPGGAYRYCSQREDEPIAMSYLAKGFNVGVLNYSCAPARFPTQLAQVAESVKIMRCHAEEWHVDKIFIEGFSAGGHLAASYGAYWDKKLLTDIAQTSSDVLRPDGLILCYPVLGNYMPNDNHFKGNTGSFVNLLGEENLSEENMNKVIIKKLVTKNYPPCFIWHTYADMSVPVENTLEFALELKRKDIPFELHIYEKSGHGMSLGTTVVQTAEKATNARLTEWLDMSAQWMGETHESNPG